MNEDLNVTGDEDLNVTGDEDLNVTGDEDLNVTENEELNVTEDEPMEADEMPDHCGRCIILERELEAAKRENENLKRKRRSSSHPRQQPERHVNENSIRAELENLKADLDSYAGRGQQNRISDKMKFKIVSSLTKNNMSIRQIESEIKDLMESIAYFKKFTMPSRHPIQTVAYSISSMNLHHSISFLESSKDLWCGFDGSSQGS
jgi:hypothetical protein